MANISLLPSRLYFMPHPPVPFPVVLSLNRVNCAHTPRCPLPAVTCSICSANFSSQPSIEPSCQLYIVNINYLVRPGDDGCCERGQNRMHNTYIYICPLFARAAKRNCQCKDDEPADGGVAGEELVPGVVPLHCRRSQESMQQDLRAAQSSLRGGAADKGRGPGAKETKRKSCRERLTRLLAIQAAHSSAAKCFLWPAPDAAAGLQLAQAQAQAQARPIRLGHGPVPSVACRLSSVACCLLLHRLNPN